MGLSKKDMGLSARRAWREGKVFKQVILKSCLERLTSTVRRRLDRTSVIIK